MLWILYSLLHLMQTFDDLMSVLKPTGTFVLNIKAKLLMKNVVHM